MQDSKVQDTTCQHDCTDCEVMNALKCCKLQTKIAKPALNCRFTNCTDTYFDIIYLYI